MIETPASWKHDSRYRLNADEKSIEYTHRDDPHLRAIVEAMLTKATTCLSTIRLYLTKETSLR